MCHWFDFEIEFYLIFTILILKTIKPPQKRLRVLKITFLKLLQKYNSEFNMNVVFCCRIPSTKNESVVGPNETFATQLEQEIGIIGIDMYASNKGKVPFDYNMSMGKKKNDMIFFPVTSWLGEIAEVKFILNKNKNSYKLNKI